VGFRLDMPVAGRGCVLRVQAAGASALLTLDVDGSGWNALRLQGQHHDFVMLAPAAEDILDMTGIDATVVQRRTWLLGQRQDSVAGRLRWERLNEQALRADQQLLDATSVSGLRVRIGGADLVDLGPRQRWHWGAWAGRMTADDCRAPQSGQQ
jgi:hypothetical protein